MSALKKCPPSENSTYKLAAAALRAKLAESAEPIADEVKPFQGRIHVTLSGKPISRGRHAAVFGPSSIDIPEFSIVRKGKTA
ncbi:MAG: hypothetical protein ABIT83_00900 [Massilia sp.]